MLLPRSEYPRPQMRRADWLCLNGEWDFQRDYGDSGFEQGFLSAPFTELINVPFCPESSLSGIGHVDFMAAVWYRKHVVIPSDWSEQRILLHFQAVDYDATVWVNGEQVAIHRGGFCGFEIDITPQAQAGQEIEIVVRARDDHRQSKPMGKQASSFGNEGCHYTRSTGIWQTVWLEPVPPSHLLRPHITPIVSKSRLRIAQQARHAHAGMFIRARCLIHGEEICSDMQSLGVDFMAELDLDIPEQHVQLWDTHNPFLYDLSIELLDENGNVIDQVESYAGLRSVAIDEKKVLINGKPVFQRLVLDQGYYADGIMTAPSEAALIEDIEISIAAGFNGARLHQKVFEERFLYHADRLGYLVWGEFGDWAGNTLHRADSTWSTTFITQWLECVERDYSHPSIIGWCPLNETHSFTHQQQDDLNDLTLGMYNATKAADHSRPVLDASGYCHRVTWTDIYDSHDYDQNPETFDKRHAALADNKPFINKSESIDSIAYQGQPYFVSEFGGTWWNAEKAAVENGDKRDDSWGYGQRVRNLDEFYARFNGLCTALLQNKDMFGYCYTQLTDVFQEENGLYNFDRSDKFDVARIHAVQTQVAAIEQDLQTQTK